MRHEVYLASIKEEEQARESEKQDVIRQLAEHSDRSAQDIIADQLAKRNAHARFELPDILFEHTGANGDDEYGSGEEEFDPLDEDEDADTVMPIVEDFYIDPWTEGVRGNLAYRGGGYEPAMVYRRAIHEAFSGLFWNISTK